METDQAICLVGVCPFPADNNVGSIICDGSLVDFITGYEQAIDIRPSA